MTGHDPNGWPRRDGTTHRYPYHRSRAACMGGWLQVATYTGSGMTKSAGLALPGRQEPPHEPASCLDPADADETGSYPVRGHTAGLLRHRHDRYCGDRPDHGPNSDTGVPHDRGAAIAVGVFAAESQPVAVADAITDPHPGRDHTSRGATTPAADRHHPASTTTPATDHRRHLRPRRPPRSVLLGARRVGIHGGRNADAVHNHGDGFAIQVAQSLTVQPTPGAEFGPDVLPVPGIRADNGPEPATITTAGTVHSGDAAGGRCRSPRAARRRGGTVLDARGRTTPADHVGAWWAPQRTSVPATRSSARRAWPMNAKTMIECGRAAANPVTQCRAWCRGVRPARGRTSPRVILFCAQHPNQTAPTGTRCTARATLREPRASGATARQDRVAFARLRTPDGWHPFTLKRSVEPLVSSPPAVTRCRCSTTAPGSANHHFA